MIRTTIKAITTIKITIKTTITGNRHSNNSPPTTSSKPTISKISTTTNKTTTNNRIVATIISNKRTLNRLLRLSRRKKNLATLTLSVEVRRKSRHLRWLPSKLHTTKTSKPYRCEMPKLPPLHPQLTKLNKTRIATKGQLSNRAINSRKILINNRPNLIISTSNKTTIITTITTTTSSQVPLNLLNTTSLWRKSLLKLQLEWFKTSAHMRTMKLTSTTLPKKTPKRHTKALCGQMIRPTSWE